jgi:alcohol dehydrogenase class IV
MVLFTHHLPESLTQARDFLRVKRAFLVTDPGVASLPMFGTLKEAMDLIGFEFVPFTNVLPNPTDTSIMEAAEALAESGCDVVIGFGGGSSIDTAKAAAIVLTNGGHINSYYGVNTLRTAPLPVVAIPTTAGSGADVTQFIAIVDSVNRTKAQVLDPQAAPDVSIIYPENLIGIPKHLIPAVGFDSLTHAIEGYINAKANAITEPLCLRAFRMMSLNLERFYADNTDLAAASELLLATTLGCMACSSIGTGDAHCIARSVGGRFGHIHHGTALGVILPHVLNFNLEIRSKKLAALAAAMELGTGGKSEIEAAQTLVTAIQNTRDSLGLPASYKELGMDIDSIEDIAKASKYKSENGSSAGAPPRKATVDEYRQLILDAYDGKRIAY